MLQCTSRMEPGDRTENPMDPHFQLTLLWTAPFPKTQFLQLPSVFQELSIDYSPSPSPLQTPGEENSSELPFSCSTDLKKNNFWKFIKFSKGQTWRSPTKEGAQIFPFSSVQFSSVHFSCSVVSDSLGSHESQHARPPCPSLSPRVHSNSRPSNRWCHPAISSSVFPFSSCIQSLPTSESFHEVVKVLEFQL